MRAYFQPAAEDADPIWLSDPTEEDTMSTLGIAPDRAVQEILPIRAAGLKARNRDNRRTTFSFEHWRETLSDGGALAWLEWLCGALAADGDFYLLTNDPAIGVTAQIIRDAQVKVVRADLESPTLVVFYQVIGGVMEPALTWSEPALAYLASGLATIPIGEWYVDIAMPGITAGALVRLGHIDTGLGGTPVSYSVPAPGTLRVEAGAIAETEPWKVAYGVMQL